MIFYFKNSFFASVFAILGSILVIFSVSQLIDGMLEIPVALLLLAIGVALYLLGRKISHDKSFKKWWQQVIDAGLEPKLSVDQNLCYEIYKKNPQKRTIEKIRTFNPQVAERLDQITGKKK